MIKQISPSTSLQTTTIMQQSNHFDRFTFTLFDHTKMCNALKWLSKCVHHRVRFKKTIIIIDVCALMWALASVILVVFVKFITIYYAIVTSNGQWFGVYALTANNCHSLFAHQWLRWCTRFVYTFQHLTYFIAVDLLFWNWCETRDDMDSHSGQSWRFKDVVYIFSGEGLWVHVHSFIHPFCLSNWWKHKQLLSNDLNMVRTRNVDNLMTTVIELLGIPNTKFNPLRKWAIL